MPTEDDKRTQDEPPKSPRNSGATEKEKRGSQNSANNDKGGGVPPVIEDVDSAKDDEDLGDYFIDDDYDDDGNEIDGFTPRSSYDKEETRSFLDDILDFDPVAHSTTHVHFDEGTDKPTQQEGDEEEGPATWATNSFAQLDNALDELMDPNHSSNAPKSSNDSHDHPHRQHHSHNPQQEPHTDVGKALVKLGNKANAPRMTKLLKPQLLDEETQSGISSWDWLSRLEQLLIHFFLTIFESKDDDSKLIIEMMPTEAGYQVEEIFKLLMKAEPDMYKDLGHLITLAENWLIQWRGDSEEKEKAVDFVRMYLKKVKGRNYYKLPIQVRLYKLGAFIAGLRDVSKGGQLETIKYPVFMDSPPINPGQRLRSPRVKPATHFSRVVANILSGRPCDDPLPMGGVYADGLGQRVFKHTLHGDKEFQAYTEAKYGDLFDRADDIFFKKLSLDESGPEAGGDVINPRNNCTVNANCWLPVYNQQYIDGLKGRGKCIRRAQKDFSLAMAKACQAGPGLEKCRASKIGKHAQFNKLYEWVKGPDGKLYKKMVGSYADLGAESSVDSLFRRQGNQSPKKGQSKHKSNNKSGAQRSKGGRGGGKTASDTRPAQNKGHQTGQLSRQGQPGLMGKNAGVGTSKDTLNKKGYVGAYRGDNMSRDGSGDSDDGRGRNKKGKKKDPYANVGRGGSRSGNIGVHLKMKPPKEIMHAAHNRPGQQGYGNRGASPGRKNPQQSQNTKAGTSGRQERPQYNQMNRSNKAGTSGRPGKPPRYSYMSREDKSKLGHYHEQSHMNVEQGWENSHRRPQSQKGPSSQRGPYAQRGSRPAKHSHFGELPSQKGTYTVLRGEDWDGEEWHGRGGATSDSEAHSGWESNYMTEEQKSMMVVNECYEKAAKMLKRPSKLLVVPPAENLMLHLEQKFQGYKWGKGLPIALRKYPNGTVFVAQYANGGSRVYYPHGGLAIAISGPSPKTSQILVVKDPTDHIFFFDKALMASLNSSGKGTIFGDDGVVSSQYSSMGGFKFDSDLGKGCRWFWNQGGQRIIMKLNKYMSIRMSDFDKIYLNYNGNRRGFLVNVATGMEVSVMSAENRISPAMLELGNLIRPKPVDQEYDYRRGRYIPEPTLGFVDKEKHWAHYDDSDEDCPLGIALPDPYASCPNDPTSFFRRMFCNDRSYMRNPNEAMACHHRSFGGQRDDRWWQ